MASPQDLQGGAFTDNDGGQSSERQCSRQYYDWDGNKFVSDSDGGEETCRHCGFSGKWQNKILPAVCEECEERDKAEGNNSRIEQLELELSKAKGELAEWNKLKMLRQVSSEFSKTEDGKLLNWLLMKRAYRRFPLAFLKEFCTGFLREVKIQMFQRNNRERYRSKDSRQAVEKEFRDLGFGPWNFIPNELSWRMQGFIFSGETLGYLQSVAKTFEPTEEEKGMFKLPWRKTKGEEFYYLCKAAAVGDEKAHCVLDSLELNGRADSGEFVFQDHNLGDIVKDTTKLNDGAERRR